MATIPEVRMSMKQFPENILLHIILKPRLSMKTAASPMG
jgi:hypothetical protein